MHGESDRVFSDFALNALTFFVVLVILLIFHIAAEKSKNVVENKGLIVVEIEWSGDYDTDVDLWVKSPTDSWVSYMRRMGEDFSLLRDDRGHLGETPPYSTSREMAALTANMPDGEYTVNIVWYGVKSAPKTIDVHVTVNFIGKVGGTPQLISARKLTLTKEKETLTVVNFKMEDRSIVQGSVNHIYTPISFN